MKSPSCGVFNSKAKKASCACVRACVRMCVCVCVCVCIESWGKREELVDERMHMRIRKVHTLRSVHRMVDLCIQFIYIIVAGFVTNLSITLVVSLFPLTLVLLISI